MYDISNSTPHASEGGRGRQGGRHGRRFARAEAASDNFGPDEAGRLESRRHSRGGRGPQGFRRGRRRLFDHGELRYVILSLINEKPHYGYEIIKAIEERVGGAYSPSPGIVYPTLTMLEELGYATVTTNESGKKLYASTPQGGAFLGANQAIVEGIFARMAEAQVAHGGSRAPEIVRAVENLKLALHLRLSRGPLNREQIGIIAATLDGAAGAIERS